MLDDSLREINAKVDRRLRVRRANTSGCTA
jgi:hypothetical protein